ncbi:MAG: hypothetical protein AB7F94_03145 [Nitrospira sp.]
MMVLLTEFPFHSLIHGQAQRIQLQQDMIFFVLLSYCCKIKAKELQNYTVHGTDWWAETDNDPGIKIHQGEGESMWAVSGVSLSLTSHRPSGFCQPKG